MGSYDVNEINRCRIIKEKKVGFFWNDSTLRKWTIQIIDKPQ
jgi:hypothetical protein